MRKDREMGLFTQYDETKTRAIKLLDVNDYGSNVWVTFQVCYKDGTKKVVRSHVKDLRHFCSLNGRPKPIKRAECLGTVYCGVLKTDGRTLFVVTLADNTVQLLQAKEGSSEYMKLMELSF